MTVRPEAAITLLSVALLLMGPSCARHSTEPGSRDFNVVIRYGVLARNELNTFTNTFTKDLILDGVASTRLVLSDDELSSIRDHFLRIDIFTYPDTFDVAAPGTVGRFTPSERYILRLQSDGRQKSLFWEDNVIPGDYPDERAARLRAVLIYIRNLIETKPEYQFLPPARGGYD